MHAVAERQALPRQHDIRQVQPFGRAGEGGCRTSPRLLFDLDDVGTEIGEETSERRAVPGGIRFRRGAAANRDRHGPNAAVIAPRGLLLVRHAGRHPAIGNGGGNGHAETRESLELSAGRGIGIDAGHDDGAHANNLAPRGADSKAHDAG